jgi:hypothetical protein
VKKCVNKLKKMIDLRFSELIELTLLLEITLERYEEGL